MSETIYCNGAEIPNVGNSINTFLYKTTILYGASNTGKTVLIRHIMHLLKNDIPNIVVFNPTNRLNNTYTNVVPNLLIHDNFDLDVIKGIYSRQVECAEINILTKGVIELYNLLIKYANENEINLYNQIQKLADDNLMKLEFSSKTNNEKKIERSNIEEVKEFHMKKYLKIVIVKNIKKYSSSMLSDEQKKILKFINFNPNILIVADDCASNAKEWGKSKEVMELFFNGRHYKITTLIAIQDDTLVPPSIRTNAFNSIFTTEKCALSFFMRKTNNFTIDDIKLYKKFIECVFRKNCKDENYKKIIYCRSDPENNFKFILGNIYDDFKFGSNMNFILSDKCKEQSSFRNITKFSRLFEG
jgi:tRNA A37 threonylcarbamoyladenosine biosynthesis protein TsaE